MEPPHPSHQPGSDPLSDPVPAGVTADIFLGGAVTVYQPERGFRAGTDSVLLAAALEGDQSGLCLELGCGAGGALLPAAWRLNQARFVGLERDQDMAALARRGVAANGVSDRVEIVDGDAAHLPPGWANRYDLVFANPPFFEPGAIAAPGPGKSGAYLESLPLAHWIEAMLWAVRPKGRFVMIHRAAALTEILSALHGQAGEIAILPVRAYPGADAKRVIVRARKGLRPGPTRLLAGIDLYESAGGARSETSLAMSARGEGLSWQAV
ncbi:MAG: methyltransferase domain-containing protein [Pseudomonadota bacterium]